MINSTPTVKVVIYDGKPGDKESKALETIKAANGGITVLTLDELKELGKKEHHEPVPPTEDGKPRDLHATLRRHGC